MKLLYIVIDGAADRPDGPTPLELAETPVIDSLVAKSKLGLMYPVSRGIAPESDSAVLSLLSYDPHRYYTGRGPLEALGAGIRIRDEYEVAFRANFATVDPKTMSIIDRRCGRDLTSYEAHELARALDGMEFKEYDAYIRVKATVGHRAVVVVGSKSFKLSDEVENTDPAYVKRGVISIAVRDFEAKIKECIPLEDSEEARRTAHLVNMFTRKAIVILNDHEINRARSRRGKLKANAILLRDAGNRLPDIKTLKEKFGLVFGAVVEMPVERGIARLLGMEMEEVAVEGITKIERYHLMLSQVLKLLARCDVVYVHLKGPDEPAHDKDLEGKIKAIELIDSHFFRGLLEKVSLEETSLLVTSDHATPYLLGAHTDDPVVVMLYNPKEEGDGLPKFTERMGAKGSLGFIKHGWELLPRVLRILKMIK